MWSSWGHTLVSVSIIVWRWANKTAKLQSCHNFPQCTVGLRWEKKKKMRSVYSSSGIIIGYYSHHTCNILVKWKKYPQPGKKGGTGGVTCSHQAPIRPAGVAAIMQAVMYNSSGRMQVRIEMASHGAVTRLCVMEYAEGLHCCLHSAKARHLSTNWRINGQTQCRNQSIKYI